MESVTIKIAAENTVRKEGLLAEHGLSFGIKIGTEEYLFDTGQSLVLAKNARELGIDLSQLEGVILSHGHYDHGGGLSVILAENPEVAIYAHPEVFVDRYSKRSGGLEFRGLEVSRQEIANFVPTAVPTEINDQLQAIGEVPRQNDWEVVPDKYRVKRNGELIADDFRDDQALMLETRAGIVVVLGCTHAGVVNTLDYIQQLTDKPINTIIGGMHLINAPEARIDKVADYLANLEVERVIPLHCTGERAVFKLQQKIGINVELAEVGTELNF